MYQGDCARDRSEDVVALPHVRVLGRRYSGYQVDKQRKDLLRFCSWVYRHQRYGVCLRDHHVKDARGSSLRLFIRLCSRTRCLRHRVGDYQ